MSSLEKFFSAWSMTDASERAEAVKASVTDDAKYADPRTEEPLKGPEAIADYVGMFSQAAPGAAANVVSEQTRHGMTRATIEFKMADGKAQMGQYFIEMEDGKLRRMIGFVGTGAPE